MKNNKDKGSGNLYYVFDPGDEFAVDRFEIHLSAACGTSENLTITKDSSTGAEYNVIYNAKDLNALTDYVWMPARPIECASGDKLIISFANTDDNTWGMSLYIR